MRCILLLLCMWCMCLGMQAQTNTPITNLPIAGTWSLAQYLYGDDASVSPHKYLGSTIETYFVHATNDLNTVLRNVIVGSTNSATLFSQMGLGTLAYSNVAVLIGATNTGTLTTQLGLSSYTNTSGGISAGLFTGNVSGALTNTAATALTVASYDANKKVISIPNGSAGYLHDDGSGNFAWSTPGGGGDVTQVGQNNFTGSNSLAGFTMFLGPVQITNNSLSPSAAISSSNSFQIDTPQLKKALQLDTNGNVYVAGFISISGGTGTTTNNNLLVQGWEEVDGYQTNKGTNYGISLILTNSANGGSWKSPTNAPANGQIVTATGTAGDTKWATGGGGGDVTQAGNNVFTGYNIFEGPTWFSNNTVFLGGTSTNTINTDMGSALFDSVHNYEYAWWKCSTLGNPNVFGDFYSSQGGHSVQTAGASAPNSDDYVTQSNGQTNGIQGSANFIATRDLKFMSHVALVQTNSVRYYIGLSTHSFDTMPGSENPSGAYVCWKYSDAIGNTLHCVTKDTFTQTDVDSLVPATQGPFHKYGIFITSAGGNARFYLDGNFITNITTHLPSSSQGLLITVCGTNTSTGTKDVQIAKTIVQQTDP